MEQTGWQAEAQQPDCCSQYGHYIGNPEPIVRYIGAEYESPFRGGVDVSPMNTFTYLGRYSLK